uniref:hydroxymethylglutaryl-CoA reductase (NADPH) n=1 Tax=Globodera pallida TaxID=36090 RepID=A0A183CKX4_GLOPA
MAAALATNCIDLNQFSTDICSTVEKIVLERLGKEFGEKIADETATKYSCIAQTQFDLIGEKIRNAVHELCRHLAERCNNGGGIVVDGARSRGPSFIIGDDSSSTTSATPSIASSGVHSAACCSDEGVQVDLPPPLPPLHAVPVGAATSAPLQRHNVVAEPPSRTVASAAVAAAAPPATVAQPTTPEDAQVLTEIEGRGKSVVAEALIPAPIVERILRTSVDKMVKLGHAKLLVGSSAAVTVGGWNAHAANVVAALFLATGQDAAQVVSSSMCLTQLQRRTEDGALHITCTMNCLEVGTVGGGTMLTPQGTCLEVTYECICQAIDIVRPGVKFREIGNVIQKHANANGFSVVRRYCGHGIHRLFHTAPNVPHYAKNKTVGVMKAGNAFTIEPMINAGSYDDDQWPDGWTAVTKDGRPSAQRAVMC